MHLGDAHRRQPPPGQACQIAQEFPGYVLVGHKAGGGGRVCATEGVAHLGTHLKRLRADAGPQPDHRILRHCVPGGFFLSMICS
jgi:hypothetical protein